MEQFDLEANISVTAGIDGIIYVIIKKNLPRNFDFLAVYSYIFSEVYALYTDHPETVYGILLDFSSQGGYILKMSHAMKKRFAELLKHKQTHRLAIVNLDEPPSIHFMSHANRKKLGYFPNKADAVAWLHI